MTNLYPHIVPMSYFEVPADIDNPAGLDAFGIVRPLGNDVASILVELSDGGIRNVHADELRSIGLDVAAAEKQAMENLSALVADRTAFQKRLTKTESGYHFITWLGEFAASCMLWPGLYEWARKHLQTDDILLSIPQSQIMFVIARGDAAFRAMMRQYMEQVVEGMDSQISMEWFTVTPDGVHPFTED